MSFKKFAEGDTPKKNGWYQVICKTTWRRSSDRESMKKRELWLFRNGKWSDGAHDDKAAMNKIIIEWDDHLYFEDTRGKKLNTEKSLAMLERLLISWIEDYRNVYAKYQRNPNGDNESLVKSLEWELSAPGGLLASCLEGTTPEEVIAYHRERLPWENPYECLCTKRKSARRR